MPWPSSGEGGPSQLSRADASSLAAEEEVSTGVLPQVLAVCTCLQIALMLLVMHRHSCTDIDSPKRNAASKLQAGAARQVARLSVAGRDAPGRPQSTGSKRAALRIAWGAAASPQPCCALSQRQASRDGRVSRRLSRIVEGNWDVDETPTTASTVQAKVRKGLACAHTSGRPQVGLGLG